MKIRKFIIMAVVLAVFSCQDDLDTSAKETVTQQQLEDLANSSPEALLTINVGVEDGQYAFMREFSTNFEQTGSRHDDYGQKSIDLGMDLLSNDMVQVQDHWFGNYYGYRGRTQDFSTTSIIWNFYYSMIRNVNSVIGQLPHDAVDDEVRHLVARARAIRAHSYFNLARIYQYTYQGNEGAAGVPLYTEANVIPTRAPLQDIYDLIIEDFDYAYTNIEGYSRPSKEKLNKAVIAGMYARVLLETGTNYGLCAQLASVAKMEGSLMTGTEWATGGFDEISNSEWIWGADINAESSTIYASFFSHVASQNAGYAGLLGVYKSIDKRLYDAIPSSDIRKQAFSDGTDGFPLYANKKFNDATFFEGDYVYMRVSEMYLIEAEAKARMGDDSGAIAVLNSLVTTRDSSYNATASGQALIEEILLQRRIELWGEGFAWFDMKRTNTDLVRNYDGSNHAAFGKFDFTSNANEFLFQIPESEINNNPDLNAGDQNPL